MRQAVRFLPNMTVLGQLQGTSFLLVCASGSVPYYNIILITHHYYIYQGSIHSRQNAFERGEQHLYI